MSFFEFRRQLEYKAEANEAKIVTADRWFPSSKTCSNCGRNEERRQKNVKSDLCGKQFYNFGE
jgi:putative transposase